MKFLLLALSLLLFSIGSLSAQTSYPKKSFKNPRETMFYFLKTMKGYKEGDQKGWELATEALDLSGLDQTTRMDSGKLAADRLINVLDRIERINISKIPTAPKSKIWTYRKESILLDGVPTEVEISIEKINETEWKFNHSTVNSIGNYYDYLKNTKVVKGVLVLQDWKTPIKNAMPEWTGKRIFLLLNGQWIGVFLIIFLALIVERFLRIYVAKLTLKFLESKNVMTFSKEKQKKSTFPLGIMTFTGFLTLGVRVLELQDKVLSVLLRGGYVAFTVGAVMTAHYIVDIFGLYLQKLAKESDNKFDDILVPLIEKTAKTFVIAIGIIFIGDSLTLDMKSILAGLGIGGLAFALAAKDTISNLFGSLTVLLDRPFQIGDWVTVGDKIEGTVEAVGLRSTRIRTFYDSLITLPNGMLTNIHIDNYGQRRYRRFNTKINIAYDTHPEKVEAFCEGIRQIILKHRWTRKDYFHVYLNQMGAHSLDILLYVFWEVPDWSVELAEKHRLLLDVLRLGNELEVEFAFPTQTLHMYQEEAKSNQLPDNFESHKAAKQLAEILAKEQVVMSKPRSGVKGEDFPEDHPSL